MERQDSPFLPMGPLRYLIMTKEHETLMGLYTHHPTGETVLKLSILDFPVYCWPTVGQLTDLLENRSQVHDALEEMRKSEENLLPLNEIDIILFAFKSAVTFHGTIMQLEDLIVHPNFYYTYRGHIYAQNS